MLDLAPLPKKMTVQPGFHVPRGRIVLDGSCTEAEHAAARSAARQLASICRAEFTLTRMRDASDADGIAIRNLHGTGEGYRLSIKSGGVTLEGVSSAGVFYGLQTLQQIAFLNRAKWPCVDIDDEPRFPVRGLMHDVSRGKVPTLETLKELARRLASFKLNQLQLYTEHTFAFRGFSEVICGRGYLGADEILEFDAYCRGLHIELVPCLATFGHMYHILQSASFRHLCELENYQPTDLVWREGHNYHHTIDACSEESARFICSLVDELLPLFSSDQFNICGDETFDLGTGRNAAVAEQRGKGRLYVDFIKKIIAHLKSHGKRVMFWGDVIYRHRDLIDEIDKDVICLNWNYAPDPTEDNARVFKEAGRVQYMCPCVTGYAYLMNRFDQSFPNITKMVEQAAKYGAPGILNTDWGDYGHVGFLANSMPGYILGAAKSWNPDSFPTTESIDRTVSLVWYGDEASQTAGLLRELSRCHNFFTWGDHVTWQADTLKSAVKADLSRYIHGEPDALEQRHAHALDIQSMLRVLRASAGEGVTWDYDEHICAAGGIAGLDAVAAVILARTNGTKFRSMPEACDVARMLEEWLEEFCRLWRRRNKESELHEIIQCVKRTCWWLRTGVMTRG